MIYTLFVIYFVQIYNNKQFYKWKSYRLSGRDRSWYENSFNKIKLSESSLTVDFMVNL